MLRRNYMLASRYLVNKEIQKWSTKPFSSLQQGPKRMETKLTYNQPFRININYDMYKFHTCYLCTSAILRKSIDVLDSKSNPRPGGGKDKAAVAKERENMRKFQNDGSPQIMLIEDKDIYIPVSLNQAERIAKRRDLKLIQVEDPTLIGKAKRPVFKLITGKEYYEISMAKKTSKTTSGVKGEKILSINGTIAANDLKGKLQNVEKWLKKGFQTKVTIAAKGSSKEHMESVFAKIEEEVSNMQGRILQRREKFGDIKFYIAPSKVEQMKGKKQGDEEKEELH